ncbi:MAG: glycosyltransferase family 2 protein [bacterium]
MRLYIGFITYGKSTAKYLPYFLPSLKAQTYKDFKVLALDNSKELENENAQYIKKNYPEISLKRPGGNIGFAKAFNLMISGAIYDGADYFLALNPDMILEPCLIEELIKTIESDETIAAVQPKILKWDFDKKEKTNIIDSYGLTMTKELNFFDKKQGETDDLSLNKTKEIFGFTGAAVLLKLKALEDVVYIENELVEYFDELMFMYKEDCDLSLRLKLAGWRVILAPKAVIFHDRTASSKGATIWQIIKNRLGKSRQIKIWSYFNQWVIVIKYWRLLPLKIKIHTAWFQFKGLFFIILFEQYLILEIRKLFKAKKEIKLKSGSLKTRIKFNDLI